MKNMFILTGRSLHLSYIITFTKNLSSFDRSLTENCHLKKCFCLYLEALVIDSSHYYQFHAKVLRIVAICLILIITFIFVVIIFLILVLIV